MSIKLHIFETTVSHGFIWSRNSGHCTESKGSFLCSKEYTSEPNLEPQEPVPHPYILPFIFLESILMLSSYLPFPVQDVFPDLNCMWAPFEWTYLNCHKMKEDEFWLLIQMLKVLANVADIIIEESEEGAVEHRTWRNVFTLVDFICCGAILFPIVWWAGTDIPL